MHLHYTSHTHANPLTAPITSPFVVALATISEEGTSYFHAEGHHQPSSSIYEDHGCNIFPSCLTSPLSSGKYDLDPKALRHELRFLRNLLTPSRAAAQAGK